MTQNSRSQVIHKLKASIHTQKQVISRLKQNQNIIEKTIAQRKKLTQAMKQFKFKAATTSFNLAIARHYRTALSSTNRAQSIKK